MAPSSGNSTFCLSEVSAGDPFIYRNGSRVVSGSVGEIRSHDNGSVHVVYDTTGSEVCVVTSGAEKIVHGNTVHVPTGERTAFVFEPSHPLLS